MKVYVVYSEAMTLHEYFRDVYYFYTEDEAKIYCDKINNDIKKYNKNNTIQFKYKSIEIEYNPMYYVNVSVSVIFAKGVYEGKVGIEFKEDGYIKVSKNWLIKINSRKLRVIDDQHKLIWGVNLSKNKFDIIFKETELHAIRSNKISIPEFDFPIFLKTYSESDDEFEKRCNDTAIFIMKKLISGNIARKEFIPHKTVNTRSE